MPMTCQQAGCPKTVTEDAATLCARHFLFVFLTAFPTGRSSVYMLARVFGLLQPGSLLGSQGGSSPEAELMARVRHLLRLNGA